MSRGPAPLPSWDILNASIPQVVATMRRHLERIAFVLRLGSVGGADVALRCSPRFWPTPLPR